jgi:SOS-response transcriptional repressor LexA
MTPRQKSIYDYIVKRVFDGQPPTVREIGVEFNIKNPTGVMCHLKALEKKGLIRKKRMVARGIEVIERNNLSALRGKVFEAALLFAESSEELHRERLLDAVKEYRESQ